jgi:glyoxylase-like metal-dependent hydrolase (beta-lactamase superfamily II)
VLKDQEGVTDWTTPGAFEVSPDLFRIPLPLPTDGLRAVNVYALLSDEGVGLIDSGWAIPEAGEQLAQSLALIGRHPSDIRRILVTHVHRDHYTQGILLRREFGSHLALGADEKTSLDNIMGPTSGMGLARLDELRRDGAQEIVDAARSVFEHETRHSVWEAPDEWLRPGPVQLSGRALEAVHTPGHTAGHLVFHDAERSQLFCGDHVLPTITPSIGFEGTRTANPLGDFLASLAAVRAMPDARLLPAHGAVTDSVHARVDELIAHHGVRLDASEAAVRAGASTAYEVAKVLPWTRRLRKFSELDAYNQMLAVNETATHLKLLVSQGRCTMTTVDDVRRYA